eukprot:1920371-Rhodomonas_salina.1
MQNAEESAQQAPISDMECLRDDIHARMHKFSWPRSRLTQFVHGAPIPGQPILFSAMTHLKPGPFVHKTGVLWCEQGPRGIMRVRGGASDIEEDELDKIRRRKWGDDFCVVCFRHPHSLLSSPSFAPLPPSFPALPSLSSR